MGQGKLGEVILRDTRANQPAATAVADGTWYYVTDEFITERSNGATWEDCSDGGPGGGITALTTDVTATGPGAAVATIANNAVTTVKINNDAVTYAKIQDVSATDRLLGRDTAAAGIIEEIPVSSGLEFTGGPGLRTTAAVRTQQIGITVDGAGSVVTTGIKGYKSFPVAGTITGWRLLADIAGDVDFDVTKDVYASYPPTTSIITPGLSGVDTDEDTVSIDVAAGDVFGFEITGTPATITRVTLELTIVVT